MWMVRNNGGDFAEEFIKRGIVSIGWKDVGALDKLMSRDQIIQKVRETWPEYKKQQAIVAGSQLDKFANAISVGDPVTTYDPSKRIYHVGRISGPYNFDGDAEDNLANWRSVNWDAEVQRDTLSEATKNSLGSSLTIFELSKSAEKEISALLNGHQAPKIDSAPSSEEDITAANSLADLKTQAKELVKDRVAGLDWSQMQDLVAGILRAMGYKTQVSPHGSDRGKDIVASPDGFGFENPRIVVEVKHRPKQPMGSPELRSFLGGRHKDDRGLYVSSGGFTKEAKYEAERASIPLTLLDIDDLVETLLENYEQLDLSTRTLVPLTRLYWPT